MPEHVRSLRAPPAEARAEDDVRRTPCDRLDEGGDVRRVVFEIRVLDHHDLTVDVVEPGADRGALASVGLSDDGRPRPRHLPRLEDHGRCVGRPVVDDDHLLVEAERLDPVEHRPDRRSLVEGGDDERHPDRRRLAGEFRR